MSKTLSQKRASFALEKVSEVGNSIRKEFKTFVAGAPSIILKNGFGQALAFWYSKGTDSNMNLKHNDKHIILINIIREWLSQEDFLNNNNSVKEFIQEVLDSDQSKFLTLQQETLNLLEWVKRFAAADLNS